MEFGFKASDSQPSEDFRAEVIKCAEEMFRMPLAETAFVLIEISSTEYKLVPKKQIAESN